MPKGLTMSEELEIDLESEEYKADPVAYINKLHNAQVDGLKTKNAELLGKLSKAKPVDTTELESLRAFKSQADIKAEELQGNYDTALQMAKDTHAAELEKEKSRADEAEKTVRTLLIDNGLSAALDAAKVMPEAKEAATALFRSSAIIEDGKAVINDKPLEDHIKEWSNTDQGKFFIQAPNNQGGGAHGGGQQQSAKKFSEMGSDERTKLFRENPEEYQRLRDAEQPQRKF